MIVSWPLAVLFVELHPLCLILILCMKFYLTFLLLSMICGSLDVYDHHHSMIIIPREENFLVEVENVSLLDIHMEKRVGNYIILKRGTILFLEMCIFMKLNFLLPIILLHLLHPLTLLLLTSMTLFFCTLLDVDQPVVDTSI